MLPDAADRARRHDAWDGYVAGTNHVTRDGRVWKTHLLRVPPACETALEACAWTFNMQPHDFTPLVES